jgi:hypothetical protein
VVLIPRFIDHASCTHLYHPAAQKVFFILKNEEADHICPTFGNSFFFNFILSPFHFTVVRYLEIINFYNTALCSALFWFKHKIFLSQLRTTQVFQCLCTCLPP